MVEPKKGCSCDLIAIDDEGKKAWVEKDRVLTQSSALGRGRA